MNRYKFFLAGVVFATGCYADSRIGDSPGVSLNLVYRKEEYTLMSLQKEIFSTKGATYPFCLEPTTEIQT